MAVTASTSRNIIRFRSDDGEELFGVFADADETRAKVGERDETGRLRIGNTEKHIDLLLPPLDPPAIFCVGLNYVDHAAEVKLDIPKTPIIFMKSINTLTGHNSAYVEA